MAGRLQLTQKANRAINQAERSSELRISDITLWEVAMLIRKKLL